MHFLGLILLSIARILDMLINLYTFVVAFACIITWVNPDPYNPIVRFLNQATQPVFTRVRRLLPKAFFRTPFDVTPIVVFILLIVIETVFVGMIFDAAHSLMAR
ncbi:MAG: YggT family protein [Deltaproteobacteria bacterium]|nr:MAG: YggT family protein [Deltaproteobacteria bacterium]